MNDQRIYRIAGVCGLAAIGCCFVEYPFYIARSGAFSLTDPAALIDITARNATNSMCCVFMDFVIISLILAFAAGFRHLILKADPRQEWLATLFYGLVLVYLVLTLVSDCLQAAADVDALTPPANATIIRGLWESTFLMYGAAALWLMGLFMAIAAYLTFATRALPDWSGWVACACALGCFAFVPSMFVHHVDLYSFYNPAGWGATALASGLPIAVWMVVTGILMLRKRAGGEIAVGLEGNAREMAGAPKG